MVCIAKIVATSRIIAEIKAIYVKVKEGNNLMEIEILYSTFICNKKRYLSEYD